MISKLLSFYFFCFLILVAYSANAQIETNPSVRQVLSSTGGSATIANWGTIDYTVGEVIVASEQTAPSSSFPSFEWLTQGFQQPDNIGLVIEVDTIGNSLCIGANNGFVRFKVRSHTGPVKFTFAYEEHGTDSAFYDLPPGIYPYSATDDKYTVSGTITIVESQVECGSLLQFYSGITPNGDGENDTWIIDSITNFHSNIVTLFNRWGNLVWTAKNYNNEDVVWQGTNKNNQPLPAGTYFYIVEAGEKIYKGWVELTY